MNEDAKTLAAEQWYGYGRWGAPYWFIGKEPGGEDEPEQYASWVRLGAGELIDCRQHDDDCVTADSPMLWHGENAKLQQTWRPLIALLLSFKGTAQYDTEEIRRYQDEHWGSAIGETAVIDLSAVAVPNTTVVDALRLTHIEERIATIQSRLDEHKPRFVVFYGGGIDPVFKKPYLERWSEIAGLPLTPSEIATRRGTLFVATPHPTAFGIPNSFWMNLGCRLRLDIAG